MPWIARWLRFLSGFGGNWSDKSTHRIGVRNSPPLQWCADYATDHLAGERIFDVDLSELCPLKEPSTSIYMIFNPNNKVFFGSAVSLRQSRNIAAIHTSSEFVPLAHTLGDLLGGPIVQQEGCFGMESGNPLQNGEIQIRPIVNPMRWKTYIRLRYTVIAREGGEWVFTLHVICVDQLADITSRYLPVSTSKAGLFEGFLQG